MHFFYWTSRQPCCPRFLRLSHRYSISLHIYLCLTFLINHSDCTISSISCCITSSMSSRLRPVFFNAATSTVWTYQKYFHMFKRNLLRNLFSVDELMRTNTTPTIHLGEIKGKLRNILTAASNFEIYFTSRNKNGTTNKVRKMIKKV